MRLPASRAWLLAAGLALAYLIVAPASADLAAQEYRAALAGTGGFAAWDNAWYAGHHLPGYSLLFPALASFLTPPVVGALAVVAASWLFARIAADHWGENAWLGAWWFAAGAAGMLLTGRLTFALGLAAGLATIRLAQRGHPVLAPLMAAVTTAASPVAGLFVAMGAVAWFLVGDGHRVAAAWLLVGALAPAAFLTVAFPEGGIEPFHARSYWPALGVLVVLFLVLPREERLLRVGIVIYALACTASFLLATPMGNNVTRLGSLFAGPLLACALWPHRRGVLALCALPLVYWQFLAPVNDATRISGDPSVHAPYYQGLLRRLDAETGPPFRVEIPFTRSHWEARFVAPHRPLARGWERQLDIQRNGVFYRGGPLTPARYRRWLDEQGVRFVALPDVQLDHSAQEEARLVRAGLPYLTPVWRDAHWTLYEVRDPQPIARGGARLTQLDQQAFTLVAPRPGTNTVVHVHFTPYWKLDGARGCVSRTPDDWTRVTLRDAGTARVIIAFSLGRVGARSPRCTD